MRAWDWWGGRGQEKEHAGRNRMMRVEASSGRYGSGIKTCVGGRGGIGHGFPICTEIIASNSVHTKRCCRRSDRPANVSDTLSRRSRRERVDWSLASIVPALMAVHCINLVPAATILTEDCCRNGFESPRLLTTYRGLMHSEQPSSERSIVRSPRKRHTRHELSAKTASYSVQTEREHNRRSDRTTSTRAAVRTRPRQGNPSKRYLADPVDRRTHLDRDRAGRTSRHAVSNPRIRA